MAVRSVQNQARREPAPLPAEVSNKVLFGEARPSRNHLTNHNEPPFWICVDRKATQHSRERNKRTILSSSLTE